MTKLTDCECSCDCCLQMPYHKKKPNLKPNDNRRHQTTNRDSNGGL